MVTPRPETNGRLVFPAHLGREWLKYSDNREAESECLFSDENYELYLLFLRAPAQNIIAADKRTRVALHNAK